MVTKILNLIKELYCREYIGEIKVEKLPVGYTVKFLLDKNTPTTISAEIENEEDFLQFMRKELKNRYWHHNTYYHII